MRGVHVRDWLSARDTLSTARNKDNGKPLGVETRLVVSRTSPGKFNTDETVYAVRYWYTEIVRYYPNGLIGINMNDHDSKTTKDRVQEFSGVSVWGRKGTHYLSAFGYGGMIVPMDVSREYFIDPKRKVVLTPDGVEYDKSVIMVKSPRPIPKGRNPAADPRLGDVLVNASGEHYIVAKKPEYRTKELELRRYYGDDPVDRKHCHVEEGRGLEFSPIFMLTSDHAWQPAERFVREMKKVTP